MKKLAVVAALILLTAAYACLPAYAASDGTDGGAGSHAGNEMSNYSVQTDGGELGGGSDPGAGPDPSERVINPGAEQESQSNEAGAGDLSETTGGGDTTGGGAPQVGKDAPWTERLIAFAKRAIYWLQYTLLPWLKHNKLYIAVGLGALLLLWIISSIVKSARRRRRRRERQRTQTQGRDGNA